MIGKSESRGSSRTLVVSFSGVDGAGKTTQIDHLISCLEQQGCRIRLFRFWDDVASFTGLREGAGHTIFRGDKGIGSPEAPINRRDKNVRGWPMACLRLFLYIADAVSLRNVYEKALRSGVDCVIFDRYIYDELANLNLESKGIRGYARWIMRLTPKPDISFILDADPCAARARKPEYPLEFIEMNREAYFSLSRILDRFTIIAPTNIEAAKKEVLQCTQSALMQGLEPLSFTEQTTAGQPIS